MTVWGVWVCYDCMRYMCKIAFHSVLLLQGGSGWLSFSARANENKLPHHNLRGEQHPVCKATSQQCRKQSQPFPWCWTLLLGRSESQLGREVAKLSLLQSSYSWLLKGALLWTVGSVCFSWPFPLPPSPHYVRQPCCSCQRRCCLLLQLMEEERHCTYGILFQTLFTIPPI